MNSKMSEKFCGFGSYLNVAMVTAYGAHLHLRCICKIVTNPGFDTPVYFSL